jgi:hypothetical protein
MGGRKNRLDKLYALPDERSPLAEVLPKGAGFHIVAKTKVDGQTWFEMEDTSVPYSQRVFVLEADLTQVK